MRLALFTDTLGDVNGVSRFILNMSTCARAAGRDMLVITSTRMKIPDQPGLFNSPPRLACPMPGYSHLEVAWPPSGRLLAAARDFQPDVIHVSTPGPVGLAGRFAAARLGVPLVGVYHTDFPQYIQRLFDDQGLAAMARWAMRSFYRPFARVITRSAGHPSHVAALRLPASRLAHLRPGIDTDLFHPSRAGAQPWQHETAVRPDALKFLYVGRVSVEKNLHRLARLWPTASARLDSLGIDAQLLIIGDGPLLPALRQQLDAAHTVLLGFRHGPHLSAIYAASDLFIFPSTTDTLGQVVMEAQSSGLPALVSDIGGPSEVVRDGRTGLVLRADDDRAWISAIVTLACDNARRRAMGLAARQWMEQHTITDSFRHFWRLHSDLLQLPMEPGASVSSAAL